MDYLKKLNDAELKFLNQFMAEYVSGAFKKDDSGEYSKENLNKTAEERRECYGRNNARSRCGLTISNATGKTFRCDDINSFVDSLTDADSMSFDVNEFSNIVYDEYSGSYVEVEEDIKNQMYEDYKLCINPVTAADKKMAESNYGKKLMLIFNNIHLKKKD